MLSLARGSSRARHLITPIRVRCTPIWVFQQRTLIPHPLQTPSSPRCASGFWPCCLARRPQLLRQRDHCAGAVGHGGRAARAGGFERGGLANRHQAGQPETLPGQRSGTRVCRVARAGAQNHGFGRCAARCADAAGRAN